MIKILCFEKNNGFAVEVLGHAGYAERGKDIVCAGVSALSQALFSTVGEMGSCGYFNEYNCKIADGVFKLKVGSYKDDSAAAVMKALFDMFYNGIYEIASSFREYVEITWCSESSLGKFTDNDTSEQTVQIKKCREVE